MPFPSSEELPGILLILSIQSVLIGALWLYPIIECAMHHPKTSQKDLWILVITLVPALGGLIYLIFGRPVEESFGSSSPNPPVS